VLAPYVSKRVETGVKVDWGTFTTTASLFRITQPATGADPITNIFSASGEQRNQGFEFNFFGAVTPGVRLLGGVTLIDDRLTKTNSPLTEGNRPYGVPDVQANLGAEWDTPFVRNLTLTGRVIYTASQFVNQTNTQSIPEWTRVDLGARYVWERPGGKPITLRADVINVANKNYWAAYSFSTSLVQNPARTFLLSAAIDF
jgi:iron complex outermembrane receptor protein